MHLRANLITRIWLRPGRPQRPALQVLHRNDSRLEHPRGSKKRMMDRLAAGLIVGSARIDTADKSEPEALAEFLRRAKIG
jgi:hypothetical protein